MTEKIHIEQTLRNVVVVQLSTTVRMCVANVLSMTGMMLWF